MSLRSNLDTIMRTSLATLMLAGSPGLVQTVVAQQQAEDRATFYQEALGTPDPNTKVYNVKNTKNAVSALPSSYSLASGIALNMKEKGMGQGYVFVPMDIDPEKIHGYHKNPEEFLDLYEQSGGRAYFSMNSLKNEHNYTGPILVIDAKRGQFIGTIDLEENKIQWRYIVNAKGINPFGRFLKDFKLE